MRMIGHLATENNARLFGDYLVVQGIDHQIEFETDAGWAVWIRDEDRLGDAVQHLARFQANPGDPRFADEARGAARKREEQAEAEAAYRKRVIDGRSFFDSMAGYGFGPVSLILIFICIAVAILSRLGNQLEAVSGLLISEYLNVRFYDVRQGQVWRLITPIFIHFGLLHILFNMLWLRDLGSMIEARKSSGFFLLQVLLIAMVSNIAQYLFDGPLFGGMSGVVYGLLGYVWMRSKLDPGSGFLLHPTTVTIMLIWLVACYSGLVGNVANAAHTVGLIAGVAWGFAESCRRR